MFARLTRIAGAQYSEDDVGPMTDDIVSQARELEAIRGGYWLRSRENGDLFAITLWDSEEAMMATEQQAASLREEAQQQAGGQVSVDHCEVVGRI